MLNLLSSPWRRILLIALLFAFVAPFSSKLPDGLEFALEKLGLKQPNDTVPQSRK